MIDDNVICHEPSKRRDQEVTRWTERSGLETTKEIGKEHRTHGQPKEGRSLNIS